MNYYLDDYLCMYIFTTTRRRERKNTINVSSIDFCFTLNIFLFISFISFISLLLFYCQ